MLNSNTLEYNIKINDRLQFYGYLRYLFINTPYTVPNLSIKYI
jgi:hypothetical protein